MIIWSGTPFNAKDPIYKAVASGAWKCNVFPVCEKFPCTKEEFRGSWPDRFPYEYVEQQYNNAKALGKVDNFNQELMLRIMSDDDRLILDHEIRWYKHSAVTSRMGAYNFYITTDFATSEKESADLSVIMVWAVNATADWFLVDGIAVRQDMGANIDDLFRFAQKYRPQSVGVEVSGQQGGFIPWIQREMQSRNNYFALASENNSKKPGIRPLNRASKMQRFQVVVPWFKAGKMYFPEELKLHPLVAEAVQELELVSPGGFKSRKDDVADGISMLTVMPVWLPSTDEVLSENSEGLWDSDEDDYGDHAGLNSYLV